MTPDSSIWGWVTQDFRLAWGKQNQQRIGAGKKAQLLPGGELPGFPPAGPSCTHASAIFPAGFCSLRRTGLVWRERHLPWHKEHRGGRTRRAGVSQLASMRGGLLCPQRLASQGWWRCCLFTHLGCSPACRERTCLVNTACTPS